MEAIQEDRKNFINTISKDVKIENKINEIISIINKNPEILNNLSIEKLKKINDLYDKKIETNKSIINELNKQISNLEYKKNN